MANYGVNRIFLLWFLVFLAQLLIWQASVYKLLMALILANFDTLSHHQHLPYLWMKKTHKMCFCFFCNMHLLYQRRFFVKIQSVHRTAHFWKNVCSSVKFKLHSTMISPFIQESFKLLLRWASYLARVVMYFCLHLASFG